MAKRLKQKKRRPLRTLFFLLLAVVFAGLFLHRSNTTLQPQPFDPVFSDLPAGFEGCRIVVLSDLHGAEFGEENADLFAVVAEQNPEYVRPASHALSNDIVLLKPPLYSI